MLDLSTLACDVFTPHVGSSFNVFFKDAEVAKLTLTGAIERPQWKRTSAPRAPFTLELLGPVQPILHQENYRLDHAALGSVELFMVPIGADAQGVQYEIHFS